MGTYYDPIYGQVSDSVVPSWISQSSTPENYDSYSARQIAKEGRSANDATNAGQNWSNDFNSILSGISDLMNEIKSANSQTNATALEESERNRMFQYEMSSTAHQREVADLQAAGLNPVLSAGGQGSSTPSGSLANVSDPSGSLSSLLASAIAGLVSIANTQSNNATQVAVNDKNLALQEMLGLKNLDLQQYGIDMSFLQTQMNNATQLSVADINKQIAGMNNATQLSIANINKQIADMNNSSAMERLVQQGHIDTGKIKTQAQMDMLKNAVDMAGSIPVGDIVSYKLTMGLLKQQGVIDETVFRMMINQDWNELKKLTGQEYVPQAKRPNNGGRSF